MAITRRVCRYCWGGLSMADTIMSGWACTSFRLPRRLRRRRLYMARGRMILFTAGTAAAAKVEADTHQEPRARSTSVQSLRWCPSMCMVCSSTSTSRTTASHPLRARDMRTLMTGWCITMKRRAMVASRMHSLRLSSGRRHAGEIRASTSTSTNSNTSRGGRTRGINL